MSERTTQKELFIAIIKTCLKLDSYAFKTYKKFSALSKKHIEKSFWLSLAKDEKKHIDFWRKCLLLARTDKLPLIFDQPENVYNELIKIENAIAHSDSDDFYQSAIALESHFLNPDMLNLFLLFSGNIKNSIEVYQKHLERFSNLSKISKVSTHFDILFKNLISLFKKNIELIQSATIDSLSKLLNRRAFFQQLPSQIELASRQKKGIAIIICDIDNFKKINDTFGHPIGDKIILEVSNIIRSSIRKYDLACRYGGEEFIICAIAENSEQAFKIAERIRTKIQNNIKTPDNNQVTASFGAKFAKATKNTFKSINQIILSADENLITAKRSGKNRIISK